MKIYPLHTKEYKQTNNNKNYTIGLNKTKTTFISLSYAARLKIISCSEKAGTKQLLQWISVRLYITFKRLRPTHIIRIAISNDLTGDTPPTHMVKLLHCV